jgi:hypothetical protein
MSYKYRTAPGARDSEEHSLVGGLRLHGESHGLRRRMVMNGKLMTGLRSIQPAAGGQLAQARSSG